MKRPALEVADIVRSAGPSFVERNRRWLNGQHEKVLLAIARCRTAALGGHRDQCSACGHIALSYNSCRNRHCPRCQGNARQRWLAAREHELLPARYVHVVFTLPRELASLALQNKRLIYRILFRASSETLLEIDRDPRHLGRDRLLQRAPHLESAIAVSSAYPLRRRRRRSRSRARSLDFFPPLLLPSREGARPSLPRQVRSWAPTCLQDGDLQFHGQLAWLAEPRIFASWLRTLFRKDWVVYAKPPFGGPEHVLRYLGGYTHRVAISNGRLVDLVDGNVRFRWRDSAHGNCKRIMTLPVDEFLRRFLLHLLPRGFVRIRHFGFLSHRRRATLLPLCFRLLEHTDSPTAPRCAVSGKFRDCLWSCPACGGRMQVVERLSATQLMLRSPPSSIAVAA
jgi:hypothetical protein